MDYLNALVGGVLIGVAVSWMLISSGRIAGVSGILGSILSHRNWGEHWRMAFIAGLLVGGFFIYLFIPEMFGAPLDTPIWTPIVAGVLVGFGTQMGSGCTSGHGVCGISRLSPRSIVATLAFMIAGFITVYVLRQAGLLL